MKNKTIIGKKNQMSANYQEKVVKALGDTIKWKVLKIIPDIMADEILQLYRLQTISKEFISFQ